MSTFQRPSETFLEIMCAGGGCIATQCGCGQFWYSDSNLCNDYQDGELDAYRADSTAKLAMGDGVHISHFRGVCWVYDCDCKVAQWLHDTEKWLLASVTDISRYLDAVYTPLAEAKEAILSIEQKGMKGG